MKKNIIILFFIFLIVIIVCWIGLRTNMQNKKNIQLENEKYEQYLKTELYGTDVVTLINKAINSNEENQIEKNQEGLYIHNDSNSILIDLVMITNEETGETTSYKMEAISKVGVTEFIKNFNTVKFECTKKEYHTQTGKISYIELTQKTT